MPWIPVPNNRIQSPDYLDLGPTAQAVLINLSFLAAGSDVIQGRRQHIANWMSFRVNWVSESLEKLVNAGFIEVAEDASKVLTVRLIGVESLPGQGKVGAKSQRSQSAVGAPSEQSQSAVGAKSETKESSIHAGFSDSPLYKIENKNKNKNEIENITPIVPTGDDKQKPSRAPKAEAPEGFAAFWEAYPKKVGWGKAVEAYRKAMGKRNAETFSAEVMVGLGKWRASQQWADGFVHNPATWLNGSFWRDSPDPAGQRSPVPILPPKLREPDVPTIDYEGRDVERRIERVKLRDAQGLKLLSFDCDYVIEHEIPISDENKAYILREWQNKFTRWWYDPRQMKWIERPNGTKPYWTDKFRLDEETKKCIWG
jgi:hypothetical protein